MVRKEDNSTAMHTDQQQSETNSDTQVSQNTTGNSLFSESSKARFSKLPSEQTKGTIEVGKKVETKTRISKKAVNKHEFDAYTIFVGNLPSRSRIGCVIL